MDPIIRPYEPADLEALYRICLLTGAHGADATPLYADPKLLGHYYAAPYVAHDPALCRVVDLEGVPHGYILGTADTANFSRWAEVHWLPALRRRYSRPQAGDARPDTQLIKLLYAGYSVGPEAEKYPAHLHIDLLPAAQGKGLGKHLIRLFCELLRARGCPGVHLGVAEANAGAIAFYEKVGFHLIARHPEARLYGLRLMP
jgi:ribosomal protein S18 acetylase RimI-like enzyme